MRLHEKINDGRIASSDSGLHKEIQVEVESEPAPKKRRLWNLKSINPLDILADVVVGVEADAVHFKTFPAREMLWHCICSSVVFPDFLKPLEKCCGTVYVPL